MHMCFWLWLRELHRGISDEYFRQTFKRIFFFPKSTNCISRESLCRGPYKIHLMTEWLFEYWYGKWVARWESIRWRDTRWPTPFSLLSFFVSSPFYCREVSDRHKARRITAQRIQKDVNWSPPWGIQIHRLWRMAPSQIISLAPTANFVAYWVVSFLKSLPASIFITVLPWMSNSISAYRQITCPDPLCERLFLCALIDMSPIPPKRRLYFEFESKH